MNLYKYFLILSIISFIAVEAGLRLAGVTDFPLYDIDEKGHYSLKTNQNGKFLNKNQWYVNSDGFNNQSELDSKNPYIVLIGDSVVYGGNPIDYFDRIGHQLEMQINKNIYVGALGGWSLYNEIEFINKNIDFIKNSEYIFIQYDNGDLEGLKTLKDNHLQKKPFLASYFVFNKYILPKIFNISIDQDLPPIPSTPISNGNWKDELLSISNKTNKKIIFVLYPDQHAFSNPKLWELQTNDIRNFIHQYSEKFDYIDISTKSDWSLNYYRDNIHPNTEGNKKIATYITKYLGSQ